MKIILSILITFILAACKGNHLDIMPDLEDPSIVSKQLTVEEMHQDIDYLIKGALARHPELSAYTNIDSLAQAAHQVKQEITKPMIRTRFYRHIGKLNHLFNDGHSFLIWPYHEWQKLKEKGQLTFPFDVVISRSGDIVIKHSYSNTMDTLTAGTVINKINGVSSNELIESLQQYVGGETRLLREQVTASRFRLALWAVYGFIDDFEIEMTQNNSASTLIINKGQNWQQIKATANNNSYYYKIIKPGVGYLYLEHFDIDPDEFEDFIDATFTEIKQDEISSLIIDIRDNPGGNTDTVTYLARHLADKPFRLVSSVREKLNQDNRGWFNYKGEVGNITNKEWTDWEKPIANYFKGDTYLLVSSISYSAAIVLATTLKDNQLATLVGETTGGFANQTAQGNLFNLPNSQLRAYIATRTLVRPSGDLTRQGVVPHHLAYNSPDDIKSQRDAGIERVLALIASK
ncbi:S41 family peptidase [Colwelliaceae bacterium 6471]